MANPISASPPENVRSSTDSESPIIYNRDDFDQTTFMMFARTFLNATTGLVWHDGENSCVLRDDDRYLGHALKSRSWRAYGATQSRTSSDELMYLGRFKTREEAKAALTNAAALLAPNNDEAKKIGPAAFEERPRVRTAGC